MPRLKTAGRVAVLAAALPLSGCAAMFGGYDLAPNGLPRAEDALRRQLAFEPGRAYSMCIEGKTELPDDDLLRLLYAGTAGRYAGSHREAGHLLDVAAYVADDRVTTSVSREALSMITSDRALSWIPGRTDRLMMPYLAALGFLEAGDLGAAAVEARRIEALLDRYDGAGDPSDTRFLHYLAATIFEAAGDESAADVAYRRAGRAAGTVRDDGGPATAATDAADLDAGEASGPDAAAALAVATERGAGDVVVLVEAGYVPHRVEQSVMVVLPPSQATRLKDGDVGEKLAAAAEAAGRILLTANRLHGGRSGYYRDHSYRHGLRLAPWCDQGQCGEDDGDAYLLRLSWPVLYHEARAIPEVRVRAGERSADAVARFDVAAGARRDFDADRATILTRTVVRAASKLALTAGARDAASKQDETLGEVVGWIANLGTAMAERADTRSWNLLPGSVSMVRLRLPAGEHELELEAGGRTVSLGSVRIRPDRTTFVTHRLWQ